jgi:hypothetical protein
LLVTGTLLRTVTAGGLDRRYGITHMVACPRACNKLEHHHPRDAQASQQQRLVDAVSTLAWRGDATCIVDIAGLGVGTQASGVKCDGDNVAALRVEHACEGGRSS